MFAPCTDLNAAGIWFKRPSCYLLIFSARHLLQEIRNALALWDVKPKAAEKVHHLLARTVVQNVACKWKPQMNCFCMQSHVLRNVLHCASLERLMEAAAVSLLMCVRLHSLRCCFVQGRFSQALYRTRS